MEIVGKIVLMPKGNYDASTTYEHLDWVRYNGSSWVCKQDETTGVTPTEGAKWSCIAEDGDGLTATHSKSNGITTVIISNAKTSAVIDTFTITDGEDGDSLTATHSKTGKTTTVTITNSRTGATVDTFTIMDGADGSGGGGGTTDYTALTNKPTINNVELNGNKTSADLGLASSSSVPTKVSQLTNDSGYLTSQYIEDVETTQFDVTGKKLSLATQIENKLSYHFTKAQWNAITDKSAYNDKIVIIDDDYNSNICGSVADCVASDTSKPSNNDDVVGVHAISQLNTALTNLIVVEPHELKSTNISANGDAMWDISSFFTKNGYTLASVDVEVKTIVDYSSFIINNIMSKKLYAHNMSATNSVNGYIPIVTMTFIKNFN